MTAAESAVWLVGAEVKGTPQQIRMITVVRLQLTTTDTSQDPYHNPVISSPHLLPQSCKVP